MISIAHRATFQSVTDPSNKPDVLAAAKTAPELVVVDDILII